MITTKESQDGTESRRNPGHEPRKRREMQPLGRQGNYDLFLTIPPLTGVLTRHRETQVRSPG